ncbi:MAG: transporter substrate-binding domain-containing protein [Chloroflexota bacterium]
MTHPRSLIIWIACLIAMIAWPYAREIAQPATTRTLVEDGVLHVGLDPSRPPFAFFTEGGDYAGIEVDLAREIGQALNIPVELVPLGFDGLYDALRTNRADVVIAGLAPEEHQNGVVYTRHYFDAGLVLITQHPDITFRDLPGRTLAYEFGAPADALTQRWRRQIAPFVGRPYELPEHAMMALHYGEADVALVDRRTARLYLREHPTFAPFFVEMVTNDWYAPAVREGRPDLVAALNTTLKALDDTGRLEAIIDRWL